MLQVEKRCQHVITLYVFIVVLASNEIFENLILNDQIKTITGYTAPVFKMMSLAISVVREMNNVSPFKLFFNKFLFMSGILANEILSDVYIYSNSSYTHVYINGNALKQVSISSYRVGDNGWLGQNPVR